VEVFINRKSECVETSEHVRSKKAPETGTASSELIKEVPFSVSDNIKFNQNLLEITAVFQKSIKLSCLSECFKREIRLSNICYKNVNQSNW